LFIKCQSLDDLWKGITEHKLSRYISKPIRILSNIVLGYKHNELEYFDLDLLFSIVGFTLLNSMFLVKEKTKPCNIMKMFYFECNIAYQYLKMKKSAISIVKAIHR